MGYRLSPSTMASAILLPPPYTGSYPIGELEDTSGGGGGPTPVLRGEVSAGGNGTITLNLPASTQVGDTVVLLHANDYYTLASLSAPTGTAVTSWTEITTARYDGGTGTGGFPTASHIKVWIGTVTTGGASTVIANWAAPSPGDEERYAHALVFAGTFSFDVATSTAQAASTTWTVPSLNAARAGSYLLTLVVTSGNAASVLTNFTFPGSMTAQAENDNVVTFRSGWELLTAAGATGTRSITSSSSVAGGITVLTVQPPAVGVTYQGAVDLTSTATLSVDGTVTTVQAGAVSLAVTSSLTSDAFLTAVAATSLSATATLSTAGIRTTSGAASLAATATLTVTPPPIAGAVSLTTSQSLLATGAVSQPGAATLAATTGLSVGTPVLGAAAAVSMTVGSSLSTVGVLNEFSAVALSATGVLSIAGIRSTAGAIVLTATPTLTSAAFLAEFGAVSLSAAATLSATGRLGAFGAVSMPALGVLTVTLGGVGGSATLTTAQSLTVAGQLTATAAIALSAVTTLSIVGVRTTAGLVTLSAVPVLTAGVSVGITNGAASLAALSILTANGIRVTSAAVVPLVATGGLSVSGSTGSGGGANLIASGGLLVSGIRIVIGATQLTALPSLVVSGISVEFAAVALTATSVLSVNAAAVGVGSVSLVSVGLLLASAAIRLAGAVNLVALPNLVFIELFPTVDIFASGVWAVDGVGLHRGRVAIERPKSGWTTAGIHVGSARS